MKKTKMLALLLAVTMVSTSLYACGGKKDDKSATQSKTTSTASTASKKEEPAKDMAAKSSSKANETPATNSAAPAASSTTSEAPATSSTASEASAASSATSEAATEGKLITATPEELKSTLSIGYIGEDQYGSSISWALNADATYGVFFVLSGDKTQKVAYVGKVMSDGENMTITDENSGKSQTFAVHETVKDGENAIEITQEDGDKTVLYPVKIGDLIDLICEEDGR